MKKKTKERKQARELRKQGKSLKEIKKAVNVSISSISVWVRDVELSEEAEKRLDRRNPASKNYDGDRYSEVRVQAISKAFRDKRRKYQQEGREKAKENDPIHRGACMLYWAEGTKNRTSVNFTNSDVNMILVFKRFLEKFFDLTNENFSVGLNFYDDIHAKEEVMDYWSECLSLDRECFIKPQINMLSKYSKEKKCGKNEWGTCKLRTKGVKNVRIVQHIYGAIKEYAGIEDEDLWLD